MQVWRPQPPTATQCPGTTKTNRFYHLLRCSQAEDRSIDEAQEGSNNGTHIRVAASQTGWMAGNAVERMWHACAFHSWKLLDAYLCWTGLRHPLRGYRPQVITELCQLQTAIMHGRVLHHRHDAVKKSVQTLACVYLKWPNVLSAQ